MSQERTEAVVVRGVDFSETSRIVTFLSCDRGRLVCIAKGARRTKGGNPAVLDTLNRVELVYYWRDGRAVQTLGEATLMDGYGGIKSDLAKTTYVAFPLELAHNVACENEPSSELYDALVHGLGSLAIFTGDVKTHTCWHVLQLLAAAGFAPAVDHCAACGKSLREARGFSYAGGVVCPLCPADMRLSVQEDVVLRVLAGSPAVCPEVGDTSFLFPMLGRYATYQLAMRFRSLRVIEEMFGKMGTVANVPRPKTGADSGRPGKMEEKW